MQWHSFPVRRLSKRVVINLPEFFIGMCVGITAVGALGRARRKVEKVDDNPYSVALFVTVTELALMFITKNYLPIATWSKHIRGCRVGFATRRKCIAWRS